MIEERVTGINPRNNVRRHDPATLCCCNGLVRLTT